jgi:hypothetical protein
MIDPDPRYAHWQQQPDEDLDYRPDPDLRDVTLETLPQIAEQIRRAMEDEA